MVKMRSGLLPLFLAAPALAAVDDAASVVAAVAVAPCLRLVAPAVAAEAACGFKGSVEYFLAQLPDTVTRSDVEAAFLDSGCSAREASVEAAWAVSGCEAGGELRRRAAAAEPAPAAFVTPAMDLPRVTDAAADLLLAVRAEPSIKLTCSTTRTEHTTTCPTQSTGADRGSVLPCVSTVVLFAKCADGMLCSSDGEACMVARTTLDTGGLIITIAFTAALVLAIALLTFMCCKERSMHKRLAAKAEAAEIAKEAAAARKAERKVNDTQPLMSPARVGSPLSVAGSGYGGGADGGSNPFNDGNRL